MIKILFVCTGNTCRSAMAEAIFKNRISKVGLSKEFRFSGAGLKATDGAPMSENAQKALKALKISGARHKAKLFTLDMVNRFDFVVTMTNEHHKRIGNFANVYTFGELAGIGGDVADPYRMDLDTYKATANIFVQCFEPVMQKIAELSQQKSDETKN